MKVAVVKISEISKDPNLRMDAKYWINKSEKLNMKICHLHLQDGFSNKYTLVCSLKDGSIRYSLYGGWSDSGTSYSLSNLSCTLPIEKVNEAETKEEFTKRIINIINIKSVYKVLKQVATEVKF